LFWFIISAVPWITGALAGDVARSVLWAVAIALDFAGLALGWPTPKLGLQPAAEMPVEPEHLAERYRLFFTIALGELIVVTGTALSGTGFAPAHTAGFVASFATTVLLWRIYIYRAGELLPAAIEAAPDPDRLARSALIAHLLMLAGVVAIAVGFELDITHAHEHTKPAWLAVMFGGPVLFLAGRAIFEYAVFARVSRDRLIGVLVLAAVAPTMLFVPPLKAAVVAALVLAGVALADAARARGRPPEPPTPPRE
ncbi:MAG TPA: low temperature requirement protein A, partial [Micromonosporaceae bacterium]|nr:low temperature requirement protein A [Micromonosporaceae bacterium]